MLKEWYFRYMYWCGSLIVAIDFGSKVQRGGGGYPRRENNIFMIHFVRKIYCEKDGQNDCSLFSTKCS